MLATVKAWDEEFSADRICLCDYRARRMEHRIARAVSAGGISGGVAGEVAGSAVAGKRAERKIWLLKKIGAIPPPAWDSVQVQK